MNTEFESQDYSDFSTLVVPLTVCIIGTVGNCLVILVILVLKEYVKSATHWYVLQLAIADLLFLLSLPLTMSEKINKSWIYSETICKLKESLLFLNYSASILFLLVISIDRYVAVCKTFSEVLQKLRQRSYAICISILVWLIALVLCTPVIMYTVTRIEGNDCKCTLEFPSNNSLEDICKDEKDSSVYKTCLEDAMKSSKTCDIKENSMENQAEFYHTEGSTEGSTSGESNVEDFVLEPGCQYMDPSQSFIAFKVINFMVLFLFPLFVMTVCYGMIVRRLNKSRLRNRSSQKPFASDSTRSNSVRKAPSSRSSCDRRRVSMMCAILVITFTICWFPYHVVELSMIAGIPGQEGEICNVIREAVSLIVFLNSALNPYVYAFLGTKFSRRLRNTMTSIRKSFSRQKASFTRSVTPTKQGQSSKRKNQMDAHSSASSQTKNDFKGEQQSCKDQSIAKIDSSRL